MKPARILLVEDEPDMAAIVIDYLRHAGYEVEHIRHGREALDRMLRSPPDLTVLDIMLPGLDGLDILRQFRPHSASPVILLTARVEEMDRLLGDRKSTRLNSSHLVISYAVFCLKKKHWLLLRDGRRCLSPSVCTPSC